MPTVRHGNGLAQAVRGASRDGSAIIGPAPQAAALKAVFFVCRAKICWYFRRQSPIFIGTDNIARKTKTSMALVHAPCVAFRQLRAIGPKQAAHDAKFTLATERYNERRNRQRTGISEEARTHSPVGLAADS
jgi:hypothetical protein